MSPAKQTLLRLYTHLTKPARTRLLRELTDRRRAPVSVLFYHRVADTHPNAWTMTPAMFERQIDWLAERHDVVTLGEARRRIVEGSTRPAVAITFDDGYADNCETALPMLLRRDLPFTYFVSTSIVRDQTAFPHDLRAGVRLRPNSVAEIRALADRGVEIGAHTRTHADVGRLRDPDHLREEIAGSIEDLRHWTGRPVSSFAFPFGLPENMTPGAWRVVHDAGVETLCSAYGAYNLPTLREPEGPLHLRRIHADPEWARFLNWMTLDPRKLTAADPIDDAAYFARAKQANADTVPAERGNVGV